MNWFWFILAVFAGAVVSGALATRLFRSLSWRIGFLDVPMREGHKCHDQAMPLLGGMALLCSWLCLVWGGILWARIFPHWLPAGVAWEGILSRLRILLVISIGGTAMAIMGLADDRSPFGWRVKLLFQGIICAGIVWDDLLRFTLFQNNFWFGYILTWAFYMFIINAFNFFDNMDGLAAGVAAIVSGLFATVAGLQGNLFVAFLGVVTSGISLGYFYYNRYPATIYMGDSGSLFLGFMLAVQASLTTFWRHGTPTVASMLIPILVLAVPIFDTFAVFWIRWRQGRSIFSGDHNHISHRFVRMGFSRASAVFLVHLLTLGVGLGALNLLYVDWLGVCFILLQTTVLLAIVVVLHCRQNQQIPASNEADHHEQNKS
ncbi:MAG: undecaprenyl/decaprenyl-phosphate alpha-N-acetylglucosaminyl 1-phosphate transferase [Lentisphaerae bacterium]|nr:MAG: undecaprenyl/decaprenyl-phosphate alpha-N-acetylglucosaminyl 1-phosphate transferase [Lentisphaerota bacterium]